MEVADELARFLRGEPIRARPLGPTGRLWRWSRRKPVLASLLTGITVLTLVILIGAPLALTRIHRAQGRAELAAAHTARLLYVSDMNLAFQALRENRLGRVQELLQRHRPQPGQEDLRSWEWGHLWHESRPHELLTLPGDNHDVSSIAYSPDGGWLAVAKHDGHVEIWDLTTHQVIIRLAHDASVWDLAFTSDRRFLVTVTRTFPEVAHRVRTWEVSTWREQANVPLTEDPYLLAVTPDNTGVVVSSGRDPTGPSTVARFELPALGLASVLEESPAREMNIALAALTFSPVGMTLASASAADGVRLWSSVDPPMNWPVQSMPNDGIGVSATAGDWMLWWTRDHQVEARNIAVPGVPPIRRQLPFPVNGRVHLSPGARWLCFADPEGNVGIWETLSLKPVVALPITGLDCAASPRATSA